MGRIADEIIREIRDRVDIVELVGRHLALKKSGRNYVGLCPFHSEKTGSFNVSPEKQSYYCFGCHEGGNAFSFLMKIENLSFPEAVRTLARECAVEVPETSAGEPGHAERLYPANEIAHAHYRKLLAAPGSPARAYLAARGLDAAAIEEFELGYAPNAWDSLAHALRAQRLAPDVGVQAGLLVERDSGGHYDRLRDRVTFPIRDVRGRVIGFGARAISAGQEPKYLNTPESPIFRKREAFYGYPDALAPMRADARAVVVEGYFDRIALARAGVGGAVATCGTALTPDHVRDLRRRTREVVLLFDADDAGQRALHKALALLLPEGLRVRAVALPAGDDPDSFAAREGVAALRARVDAATPAIEAVIHRVAARGNESVAAAGGQDRVWQTADAVAEVVPLLAAIPGAVERGEFARQLALAVGAQPRDVEEAIAVQRRGGDPREAVRAQPRRSGPQDRIIEQLVRSLIEHPGLLERIAADELLALLPAGRPAEIVRALAAEPRAERLDLDALCERVTDDTRALLRELATSSAELDAETAARILDDTIRWLRKRLRGEQSRALTRRLRDADQDWRSVFEAKQELRGRLEGSVQRRPELAS